MRVLWLLPRRPGAAPSGGDLYDAQVVAGLRRLGHQVEVTARLPSPAEVRADVVVQDALGFARFLPFNRALERAGCAARRLALVHVTTAKLQPKRGTALREAQYLASTHAAIFVSRQARAESLRLLRGALAPPSPQLEQLLTTGVVWPPGHAAAQPLGEVGAPAPSAPGPAPASAHDRRLDQAAQRLHRLRTAVIPPGADRLKLARRRAPPRAQQPLRLLCVGHLLPHKGQLALLDAFAAALPRLSATLVLAGSGELDRRYTARVRARLRSLPQARWVGGLGAPALARALGEADVFVNASDYESWGMAAAEAQAAGLPVVSWSRGGLWEFLTAGVDALRLRAPSAAALVRLAEPALLRRLSAGARRAAHASRTWASTARAFADFLALNLGAGR